MKYNMKSIMKRAWEIKREDRRNDFGLCLQIAWEEAKKVETKELTTEEKIDRLVACGAKRWQMGSMDRLYINFNLLGYTCRKYNTGNVADAWLNGEHISNSEMRRVLSAKSYVDCKTMKLCISYNDETYRAAVEKFVSEALSA